MLKTVTICGKAVEGVDVLKTSPLGILKSRSGSGYAVVHLELGCCLLTTRTKALAIQARRELSGLDFEGPEHLFVDPVREAQQKYLDL